MNRTAAMSELAQTRRAVRTRSGSDANIRRVGLILPGARPVFVEAFRQGLGELGYAEGRNIGIEIRFGQGLGQVPELAAELVGLNVDVIAAVGAIPARAVQKATTSIPIVFAMAVHPVEEGLVTSAERPGGNSTGITGFDPQQPKRQLELLKQAIPQLERVAIFGDLAAAKGLLRATSAAAEALGLRCQILLLNELAPDIEGKFAAIKSERADAVVVLQEPATFCSRKRIAEMAAAYRLPTMFGAELADAGGLFAYGTNLTEAVRRASGHVDKILKGAKPGELPIESLTRRELFINLKVAREIGVTIPPKLLKSADNVIQ